MVEPSPGLSEAEPYALHLSRSPYDHHQRSRLPDLASERRLPFRGWRVVRPPCGLECTVLRILGSEWFPPQLFLLAWRLPPSTEMPVELSIRLQVASDPRPSAAKGLMVLKSPGMLERLAPIW